MQSLKRWIEPYTYLATRDSNTGPLSSCSKCTSSYKTNDFSSCNFLQKHFMELRNTLHAI